MIRNILNHTSIRTLLFLIANGGVSIAYSAEVLDEFDSSVLDTTFWQIGGEGTDAENAAAFSLLDGHLQVDVISDIRVVTLSTIEDYTGDLEFVFDFSGFTTDATVFAVGPPAISLSLFWHDSPCIRVTLYRQDEQNFISSAICNDPNGFSEPVDITAGQLIISRSGAEVTTYYDPGTGRIQLGTFSDVDTGETWPSLEFQTGDNGSLQVQSEFFSGNAPDDQDHTPTDDDLNDTPTDDHDDTPTDDHDDTPTDDHDDTPTDDHDDTPTDDHDDTPTDDDHDDSIDDGEIEFVPAPENFNATADGQRVTFSWSAVDNATGYRLYFGFLPGVYAGSVDVGGLTAAVMKKAPPGNYYLAVEAYTDQAVSDYSSEVNLVVEEEEIIVPPEILDAPENFTVSAEEDRVTMSWSQVSDATSYRLYYGVSTGNYLGMVSLGNSTQVTIPNVPNGLYYLSITAIKGDLESDFSNESAVTVSKTTLSSAITIESVDKETVSPFEILTIHGSGFTPGLSAISAHFISTDGIIDLVVPAIVATEDSVEVVVPVIIDPDTGLTTTRELEVQVLQASESQNLQSNYYSGITIEEPPEINPDIPLGTIGLLFISAGIDSLEDAQSLSSDPEYENANDNAIFELEDLLEQFSGLIEGSADDIRLATTDGQLVTLGQPEIEFLESMLKSYVEQLSLALSDDEASGNSLRFASPLVSLSNGEIHRNANPAGRCRFAQEGLDDPFLDEMCTAHEERVNVINQLKKDFPKFAKVAYGGILAVSSGAVSGGLAAITNAGLAMRLGISLLVSWTEDLLQEKTPMPDESKVTVLRAYADDLLGFPVLSLSKPFEELAKLSEEFANPAPENDQVPKGGIILKQSGSSNDTDTSVNLIQDSGDGVSTGSFTVENDDIVTEQPEEPEEPVVSPEDAFSLVPDSEFTLSGVEGGPFTPSSATYVLTNEGNSTINFSVSENAAWLSVSPGSGSVNPGESEEIIVAVNSSATALGQGTYNGVVTFSDSSNGISVSRNVTLTIDEAILNWSMSMNISSEVYDTSCSSSFSLSAAGGGHNFACGLANIAVTVSGLSSFSVSASGFGGQEGATCSGTGSGGSTIFTGVSSYTTSGSAAGTINCTFDDDTSDSYAVILSYSASAPTPE